MAKEVAELPISFQKSIHTFNNRFIAVTASLL